MIFAFLASAWLRIKSAPLWVWLVVAFACLAAYAANEHGRAERWKDRADVEAANHRQTKANYKAAQDKAAQAARDARIETERRFSAIAKEADDANENAAEWRDRARRYADAGGVLHQAGTCPASASGLPGAAGESVAASGSDRSGQATVTLTRADFDALTENTERLIRIHDWGEKLIDDGLAVKLP